MAFNYANIHSNNTKRHNAVPPPSSGVSKQGYSTMNAISQNALSAAWGGTSRKRAATEDEYFDDDEEEAVPDLAYIPAPGSPTRIEMERKKQIEEEEDDPLDAYMAGIERQMEKQTQAPQQSGVRNDLEEEDVEESYYRYMEENPNAGLLPVDEEFPDLEYDSDGNPIAPDKKKIIDPLPPIDHSEITYEPFAKVFYEEHPEIKALAVDQVTELRKIIDITVSGNSPPKPVSSFAHFGFDDKLLKAIIKAEYSSPTPIQAQAIPCALMGRDVLGIAQTGSGKTAAFLWPMIKHIAAQKPVEEGEGPIGLILAPTRELAIQIYTEAKKFAKVYDLKVICAYGGGSKWEQSLALKEGGEIVVATPGRIIDHIKGGATNLQKVTFLVLDEADRMFELGFEPQVRSVCNHVRPDRQTLLFSATFRKRIEKLAKDALTDPIKISQGTTGQANEDVTQHALLLPSQEYKRIWLFKKLVELLSAGSVLVFVTKKLDAEMVAKDIKLKEFDCLLLHGDMEQADRNNRNSRKKGEWGQEQVTSVSKFPLQRNSNFELDILVTEIDYLIAINGKHIASFLHRIPLDKVKCLRIEGKVDVSGMGFAECDIYPRPSTLNAPHIVPFASGGGDEVSNLLDIPLTATLPKGFQKGWQLEITGRVKILPEEFFVNLQKGGQVWPEPLIYLHINPRFRTPRAEQLFVINAKIDGNWGQEERTSTFQFSPDTSFSLAIRKEFDHFSIWVDGQLSSEFKFRGNVSEIDSVFIQGDIVLKDICMREHSDDKYFKKSFDSEDTLI